MFEELNWECYPVVILLFRMLVKIKFKYHRAKYETTLDISQFLRILKGVSEDFPSKLFRFDGLKSLSIFLIPIQIGSAILVLFSLFQLKRPPNF